MAKQATLSGLITRTTESAVLMELDDGSEYWVPRSVCISGDTITEGDTDILVACWFLDKEGVSYE